MSDGLILVFAEQRAGMPADVALQLLNKARELARLRGCTVSAVTAGPDSCRAALSAAGAAQIFWLRTQERFPHDVCADALCRLILRERPEIVLFGATAQGRSIAPRVAAQLRTGLTADCTGLEIDLETGKLLQTRPTFGGNLIATIVCPERFPQMATIRPGVFPAAEASVSGLSPVIELPMDIGSARTEVLSFLPDRGVSIAHARVLVVAGKGIGQKRNMEKVRRLAALLGGDYGVSRPLVDASWAEYSHQVGQTGCAVAPELLLSLGVSGAVQHLAGIGGAKKIVAVNTDPDAPIFAAAHVSIVADCVTVADELIAVLETAENV